MAPNYYLRLAFILIFALASIPISDALIRWADWHPWRAVGRLVGRVCLWRWRREIGPVVVTPAMIERLRAALEHEGGSIDVLRMTPEMLARLRAGLVAEQRKLTEQL